MHLPFRVYWIQSALLVRRNTSLMQTVLPRTGAIFYFCVLPYINSRLLNSRRKRILNKQLLLAYP